MGRPTPSSVSSLNAGRATLRFYLADCLDVLPSLSPGSLSVVVTSPPYNLGVGYRTYEDSLPAEEYLA